MLIHDKSDGNIYVYSGINSSRYNIFINKKKQNIGVVKFLQTNIPIGYSSSSYLIFLEDGTIIRSDGKYIPKATYLSHASEYLIYACLETAKTQRDEYEIVMDELKIDSLVTIFPF